MSMDVHARTGRRARSVPMHRALPKLLREPAGALAEFARESGGRSSGWIWGSSVPTWSPTPTTSRR